MSAVSRAVYYRSLNPPTVLSYNGAVKMRRPNQTSYEEAAKVCCARGGRDGRDGLPGPPGPQGLAGALGGEGVKGERRKGGERGQGTEGREREREEDMGEGRLV